MKIDSDLRAAIRCAVYGKVAQHRSSVAREENDKFLQEFIKRPNVAAVLRRAAALRVKIEKLSKEHNKVLAPIGISEEGKWVRNADAYLKAGGTIVPDKPQRFEFVMNRIANATVEEGKKIISELGIKWE